MRKYFKAFFSFLSGLVLVLLFFEIVLRIFGAVFGTGRSEIAVHIPNDTSKTILCCGDSYTFGLGAMYDSTYPAVLRRSLDSAALGKWRVINLGQCAENSSQLKERLPVYFANYHPHTLIILTGVNNYWNLYGYEGENTGFLHRLKLVKFIKHLFYKLTTEKSEEKEIIRKMLYEFFDRRDAYTQKLESRQEHGRYEQVLQNTQKEIHKLLIHNITHAGGDTDTLRSETIDSVKISNAGDIYLEYLFMLLNKGSFEVEESGSEKNPLKMFVMAYHALKSNDREVFAKRALSMQEAYPQCEESYLLLAALASKGINPPSEVVAEAGKCFMINGCGFSILDTIAFYNHIYGMNIPFINRNEFLQLAFDTGLQKTELDGTVEKWVRSDFEKIYQLCSDHGVRLIIQTYPDYPCGNFTVNKVIRDFAMDKNIVLADQSGRFCLLKNQEKYFIADGHCNGKGYAYMARGLLSFFSDEPKEGSGVGRQ